MRIIALARHSRESGNPVTLKDQEERRHWIPDFAGMSVVGEGAA